MSFIPLDRLESVDALYARSHSEPVVLFKHSATCGLSAQANSEMERLLDAGEPPIFRVIVQQAREVSNHIEERTALRHESPQVFVIHQGEVLFNASHGAVTAEAVQEAIAAIDTPSMTE